MSVDIRNADEVLSEELTRLSTEARLHVERLKEWIASGKHKAKCLRDEADALDAKVADWEKQIADIGTVESERQRRVEDVQWIELPTHALDVMRTQMSKVGYIASPWFTLGVNARARYIGAGLKASKNDDGVTVRMLVCYLLKDTQRARGNLTLSRLYGSSPVHVDAEIARLFGARIKGY